MATPPIADQAAAGRAQAPDSAAAAFLSVLLLMLWLGLLSLLWTLLLWPLLQLLLSLLLWLGLMSLLWL